MGRCDDQAEYGCEGCVPEESRPQACKVDREKGLEAQQCPFCRKESWARPRYLDPSPVAVSLYVT